MKVNSELDNNERANLKQSYHATNSLYGVPAHRTDFQLRGTAIAETPEGCLEDTCVCLSFGESSLYGICVTCVCTASVAH